ncbi:MAG: ParB N-terminal domain-containing protein [Bacteroidales bacterium]|nr:ParB N-terminal domain-containing protein [Bacteroidales bacterium]
MENDNFNIIMKKLPLSLIDINDGQVEGLPRNPRTWTYTEIENLKKSIEETPELLEARGIIVYPYGERFVAIGGNMRLTALRSLGRENAPCLVLPADLTIDKLKEIAIKDNGSFGQWDEQLLVEDWSGIPFEEWGITLYDDEPEVTEDEPKKKEDDGKTDFKIVLEAREFDFVNQRLREINDVPEQAFLQLIRGEVGNGEE